MLPSLSPTERVAVDIYDQRIRRGDTFDNPIWADQFTVLMFYNHPEGPVVDIGCGLGRVVPILEDYGVREYLGVDPSADSIDYCQKTYPEKRFEVAEVRQLGKRYPEEFGGFIMLNVLMHTPRHELSTILSSIRQSLKGDAPGLLNFPKQGIEGWDDANDSGMVFTTYDPETFFEALEQASFYIVDARDQEVSFMVRVVAE